MRFLSYHLTPPEGVYFYELEGEAISSTSRPQICVMAKELHRRHGVPLPGDPFESIMAFMCRTLPPGYCTGTAPAPDGPRFTANEVKRRTEKLFGLPAADPVRIRERLLVCAGCPCNRKTTCPSCTGMLDWVIRNMASRSRIPADDFVYVCSASGVFASALATVDDPGGVPDGTPDTCWRRRHG